MFTYIIIQINFSVTFNREGLMKEFEDIYFKTNNKKQETTKQQSIKERRSEQSKV